MAREKKGIIITSTCALLAGAAVIAELALGGGTGGNGVGRQQGSGRIFRKKFLILHIVKKVMILLLKCRNMKGEPYVRSDGNEPAFTG